MVTVAFNDFILENKVIGFFSELVKLKSGRLTPYYVNWRRVTDDVYLVEELAGHVLSFVGDSDIKPKCFFGVPEGATKLALACQTKWAKSQPDYGEGKYRLAMGRGKPKEHGDPRDRYFLGVPDGDTIVLEDVTTTGGSLLKTVGNLQEAGVKIAAAVGLTNRNEKRDDGKTVEEALSGLGVKYLAMSEAADLLPEAVARQNPGDEVVGRVREYFNKYGYRTPNL